MVEHIAVNEVFLVLSSEKPVATFVVHENDPELWGTDVTPALYIRRLAVSRRVGGSGLGYRILNWVEKNAALRGIEYVRLATASNNPRLRRYYEDAGFRHIGNPKNAKWPTSCYERRVRLSEHNSAFAQGSGARSRSV